MQVWNVLHAASWKCSTQKWRKKSPSAHHRTILSGCIFATKAYIDNRKNLLNSNMSSTCAHNMVNLSPLTAEIGSGVWGTQQISTGFASCFRYCSDVAHRRPTKLCTMSGRLLGWYTIHIFGGSCSLAPWQNFALCKIHFTSKSCVLLYWQRYCTKLQQRARAKLCGMVQGMELRNFRRGRHLYSAGRPSRWASAHILHRVSKTSHLWLGITLTHMNGFWYFWQKCYR